MKKIAEIHIGSNIFDYERFGTPTLFVNHIVNPNHRSSWGIYQALCGRCGNSFKFENGSSLYQQQIYCPNCGKLHEGTTIMKTYSENAILPFKLRLSVVKFKSKIELRIVYRGISLNGESFSTIQTNNVKEVFCFDCQRSEVTWTKQVEGQKTESVDVGYFNEDYKTLQDKTALYFITYKHPIYKGDTYTLLLKAIRTGINEIMSNLNLGRKMLYIDGKHKHKLYTSILNIAHRVRFWDSDNVRALGQENFLNYLEQYELQPLDMSIVDFWQRQGYNYQESLCQTLNLPLIKSVRREIQFNNLYNLKLAFQEKNIGIAFQKLNHFKELDRRYRLTNYSCRTANEDKLESLKFFQAIKDRYPAITFLQFLEKYNYYKDCYYLIKQMDKITSDLFAKTKIPLKKLHDWLSVEVANQKYREIFFDIPPHIIKRFDMQLDHYNLTTISQNSQLIKVAKSLKNCCIGHKNRINKKLQLVAIANDIGKIIALLEISESRIIQAKLYGNKQVSINSEINSLVIDFAQKANLSIQTEDVCTDNSNIVNVVA